MTQNSEDEDEKSLFQRHMRDVKPLKSSPKIPRHHEKPRLSKQKKYKEELPSSAVCPLSDPYLLEAEADTILSHHQTGLMKKRVKALRQGDFMIEARLDLHGLHVDEARLALSNFIKNASQKNLRQLLIIHGKGGQQHHIAVLKSHVAHWLRQFPEVLAFHSAQPKDGGTGALYLLLKKSK